MPGVWHRLPPVRVWGSPWLHAAALLALTGAAWHGVLGGTFQYDDFGAVLSAPEGLAWRIRPLLALTFSWDRALHGDRAGGYLAENLALHALTVLAVYALARRLLSPAGAFLAGAAFALQPANAEVVAYVSGRSTGLMALLTLAALLAFLRAGEARGRLGSGGWLVGSMALFAAAVLVKEVALVFPLLLLLWGTLGRREPDLGRRVLPFALLALVLGLGLLALPRYRALAAWSLERHPPLEALAVNASALPYQLSLWLRPGALSVEHSLEDAALPLGLAAGLLVLPVLAALALRRRAPLVGLAVGWALAALLPTQSLLAKADVVTEKPLYLAWVGAALLVGGGAAAALKGLRGHPRSRLVLGASLVALLVAAATSVHERVETWSDPAALWADATRKAPRSSRAWNNLGNALRARAPEEALLAVRKSLELDPSNRHALSSLANLEVLCLSRCPAP